MRAHSGGTIKRSCVVIEVLRDILVGVSTIFVKFLNIPLLIKVSSLSENVSFKVFSSGSNTLKIFNYFRNCFIRILPSLQMTFALDDAAFVNYGLTRLLSTNNILGGVEFS